MFTYKFEAQDQAGVARNGVLNAATVHEAMKQLSSQGLRVKTLKLEKAAAPLAPPVSRPAVSPIGYQPPVGQPVFQSDTTLDPSSSDAIKVRKKLASYKDRWLFFSQLATMLRSGIAPHDALNRLGTQFHNKGLKEFSAKASVEVGQGKALSDLMQRCPWLFQRGDIGIVRAGEVGGFLPDALAFLAARCQDAHSLSRVFFWIFLVLNQGILCLPFFWMFGRTLTHMFDVANAGYQGNYFAIWGRSTKVQLLGGAGLTILLMILALTVGRWIWHSLALRRWRHGLGALIPHTRKRASAENMESFTWVLSRLGKSGISPFSAWNLAGESVPNERYADKLTATGRSLNEKATLSQGFQASGLLQPEYQSMVQTGEYTGTAPMALDELAKIFEGERVGRTAWIKTGGVVLMILFVTVLSCAGTMGLYSAFMSKVMDDTAPENVTNPEYKPDVDPRIMPDQ